MGYRSDVRIITTKKGYKELKKYTDEYIKKMNYSDKNLLDISESFGDSKSSKYFGWNDIKWYEDCDYIGVDAIMSGLKHLKDNDYSYRFARLGENYTDYDENNFSSINKEKMSLPYICLNRNFDDSYVSKNLKIYDRENKDKER